MSLLQTFYYLSSYKNNNNNKKTETKALGGGILNSRSIYHGLSNLIDRHSDQPTDKDR